MAKYTCALCGKEHNTYESYAACVQECAKKLKAQEEKDRKARLAEEKDQRRKELDMLFDRYVNALEAYERDYPMPIRERSPFDFFLL